MTEKTIALVTGAARGLGLETGRQLAGLGITVLLGARRADEAQGAAGGLRAEGLEVELVQLDITDPGQIETARQQIETRYGRLDILVNNAAIKHPEERLFENSTLSISEAALRATFEVNFFGTVAATRAFLPLLRKSEAGRIVNVSSMMASLAIHSDPRHPMSDVKPFAYDASKAALNQFTIHLAAALRHTPIKVNAAHPGWVRTGIGGDEAPMEPEEGARTAVRLATLGPDGPTGKFFHFDQELPW
ncbi:MAG: SDR family oxidoreductase [Desulfobacteraceae bacterium]|nr:SDR family oxidoreductase [Desulfobacteraceae bacterium]